MGVDASSSFLHSSLKKVLIVVFKESLIVSFDFFPISLFWIRFGFNLPFIFLFTYIILLHTDTLCFVCSSSVSAKKFSTCNITQLSVISYVFYPYFVFGSPCFSPLCYPGMFMCYFLIILFSKTVLVIQNITFYFLSSIDASTLSAIIGMRV